MADRTPRSGDPEFQMYRQGAAAVALRIAGASFEEIATALGISTPAMARTIVESDLANRTTSDDRLVLRAEEAARLERLIRSVWPKATSPDHPEHLPAAKIALALIDRHIRLHGLDAPAEVIVHTPTTSEIDQWVAAMNATAIEALSSLEASVVVPPTPELDAVPRGEVAADADEDAA